ncbi:LLM class flavin-dependent oxidoreductase [Micromonospora marina]|uniref:LLM class flavin-dependent oxidoreductase n=1 Tax=Micromonospora marina TaxID=307120 RepID=UPI0034557D5A
MRFSSFLTHRSTAPAHDGEVIAAMVTHAEACAAAGFDAIFVPDHHFTGYAPAACDGFMLQSYLAARLPGMHFGFSVQSMPLHHPVRFAERVALLDHLTQGRVLVGVGSGTKPEEMIGFGVPYADSKHLSVDNLDIVERLWAKQPSDEPVVFDNGHYRGAVVSRLVPGPHTRPRPRLMYVAHRPESVERAARQAAPVFVPGFTPPAFAGGDPYPHVAKYLARYLDALRAAGHDDGTVARCLDWTTHTYQFVHVAETDEQADAELKLLLGQYQEAVTREHAANRGAEAVMGVPLRDPEVVRSQAWQDTWCLWGSPQTVVEKLARYADLGIGNVLCGFMGGPLTPERERLGARSLDLFAREVMPRLRHR